MLEMPHCFIAQTYPTLSVGIFPTSKLSLCCLALLLHSESREQVIFPSSFWKLWVSVFTYLLRPISPLHPVYLTPTAIMSWNR